MKLKINSHFCSNCRALLVCCDVFGGVFFSTAEKKKENALVSV